MPLVQSPMAVHLTPLPNVNPDSPELQKQTSPKKRILLVDDHPGFRRGLKALLQEQSVDFEVCAEAQAAPGALDAMRKWNPDLAIVDISLPGTNGIELVKMMLSEQPRLRILILSAHEETTYALRALRAGASGYIMKTEALDSIPRAIEKIAAGGIFISPAYSDRLIFKAINSDAKEGDSPVASLSDRELEVLELLGKGHGTRDIAEILHLSGKTVETHRMHIKEKLGMPDARELVRFAIEWNTRERGDEAAGSSEQSGVA